MKTKYKFIEFIQHPSVSTVWICQNKRSHDYLGCAEVYAPWKAHVFRSDINSVFSADCLRDIAHFLSQLNGGTHEG